MEVLVAQLSSTADLLDVVHMGFSLSLPLSLTLSHITYPLSLSLCLSPLAPFVLPSSLAPFLTSGQGHNGLGGETADGSCVTTAKPSFLPLSFSSTSFSALMVSFSLFKLSISPSMSPNFPYKPFV